MKKTLAVGLLVISAALTASTQSISRCEDEAGRWGKDDLKAIRELPVQTIRGRAEEMMDCMRLEQQNHNLPSPGYGLCLSTYAIYLETVETREHLFLVRHNLTGQFEKEDAGGLRER